MRRAHGLGVGEVPQHGRPVHEPRRYYCPLVRILVTGAAGMIGRKLTERLARDDRLGGEPIDRLTLLDVAPAPRPDADFPVETVVADLNDLRAVDVLLAERPEVIIHLAAALSGEAEADFELGYRVNLEGTRGLLEAVRRLGENYAPRFVFASSIAVFGAPFPDVIGDDFLVAPRTSYGTQKAICELLLDDFSRRGILDGISIRLPTVCVRPGKPNRAASGFFSSIIREPLVGESAILPVDDDLRHWHASPRSAVGFLLHAATIDTDRLGDRRALTMPGVSVTVGEQIEALRAVAGDEAVALIRRDPDETIARIVSTWPHRFDAGRALDLGFTAETSFDQIVRAHVEDELGGRIPVTA
jgi:D-erythronate 2-dehydrogenase